MYTKELNFAIICSRRRSQPGREPPKSPTRSISIEPRVGYEQLAKRDTNLDLYEHIHPESLTEVLQDQNQPPPVPSMRSVNSKEDLLPEDKRTSAGEYVDMNRNTARDGEEQDRARREGEITKSDSTAEEEGYLTPTTRNNVQSKLYDDAQSKPAYLDLGQEEKMAETEDKPNENSPLDQEGYLAPVNRVGSVGSSDYDNAESKSDPPYLKR